eukprot:scaffold8243_cov129-Isochrysis_galbana.AAC.15
MFSLYSVAQGGAQLTATPTSGCSARGRIGDGTRGAGARVCGSASVRARRPQCTADAWSRRSMSMTHHTYETLFCRKVLLLCAPLRRTCVYVYAVCCVCTASCLRAPYYTEFVFVLFVFVCVLPKETSTHVQRTTLGAPMALQCINARGRYGAEVRSSVRVRAAAPPSA